MSAPQCCHNIGRRPPRQQLPFHKIHSGSHVFKESVIPLTQPVKTRFPVRGMEESVLGTLPIAGKQVLALPALPRQRSVFGSSEVLLLLSIHHFDKTLLPDISEFVFRKDKMVTGKDIAIVFHHSGMTASTGHSADSGLFPQPVRKS